MTGDVEAWGGAWESQLRLEPFRVIEVAAAQPPEATEVMKPSYELVRRGARMGTSCIPATLTRRVLSLFMTCDASIPAEAGRLMADGRRYIRTEYISMPSTVGMDEGPSHPSGAIGTPQVMCMSAAKWRGNYRSPFPAFHGHAGNISVNYSVYGYVESNGRH